MKIVVWNIGRVDRLDFLSQVKKLSSKFNPSILFLSQTKVNAGRSMDILPKVHFDSFYFVNLMGFSRSL